MVLRYCLGMIMSVSTLIIGRTAAIPVSMVNFCMSSSCNGSYVEARGPAFQLSLIAFGVSFVVILVMAVVSGGDAIFGELPFSILGFLIFFVVFWLLFAWIFCGVGLHVIVAARAPAAWRTRRALPPAGSRPRPGRDNICAWSRSVAVRAGGRHRPSIAR